jgi:hypothetical protein
MEHIVTLQEAIHITTYEGSMCNDERRHCTGHVTVSTTLYKVDT